MWGFPISRDCLWAILLVVFVYPILFFPSNLAFASGADAVLNAVTSSTQSSQASAATVDTSAMAAASTQCNAAPATTQKPAAESQDAVQPDTAQLEKVYSGFNKMITGMLNLVKAAPADGKNFQFSGGFFSLAVANTLLKNLPGLLLDTPLASATFPEDISDPSQMFLYLEKSVTPTTVVTAQIVAYSANVLDAKRPFNMPTISISVTVKDKPLILNPAYPVKLVAKPKKDKQLTTKTQSSTCAASVECDLTQNADQMGTLVHFPVQPGAGDFIIQFPVISFDFTAYISFNSTPNATSYTWLFNVTGEDIYVNPNPDYDPPRTVYEKDVEHRVLVTQNAINTYLQNSGSKSNTSAFSLYVFMKRDFSKFDAADMPEEACELQSCYGYHLKIGSAGAAKSQQARRRKRSVDDDPDAFEVDPESTESRAVFKSSYFGDFGAQLVIAPNTIEFTSIFANFASLLADNYAVFAFQIGCITLFLMGVGFAVKFDYTDLKQWAFLPIKSNRDDHNNKYLISVAHLSVKHYEQKPQVSIRLIGDIQGTKWRPLVDGERQNNFRGKQPANFTYSTFVSLGQLEAIEIMIRTGEAPLIPGQLFQMYIDKVIVLDVSHGRKYIFPAKMKMQTGQARRIPVADEDEIKAFKYLVSGHTRVGLSESHPWISVAQRPLPSNWTRAERLACVVSALFMAMLVNGMFYGQEGASPKVGIKIGNFFRISWFTIWTSMISCVIIIPPTSIMAFIFRRIRRRSAEMSELSTVFNIKLPDQTTDEDGVALKKPFQLPFACVFIAWLLVSACVGVSAFIVIMYSLQWGREKSLQWLFSMVMHIIQDVIIVQMVKVMLSSVFTSTFLSLPDDGLNIGRLTFSKKSVKHRTILFTRMRNLVASISHDIIYIMAFALVISSLHNSFCYRQVRDLKNLVTPYRDIPVTGQVPYKPVADVINDYSVIYDWLSTKLLPNFLSGNQIGYGALRGTNFYKMMNHDVVLLGPIRLRQQRTKGDSCQLHTSIVPAYTKRHAEGLANSTRVRCQRSYLDAVGLGDSSEKRAFNSSWLTSAIIPAPPTNQLRNLTTSQAPWVYREGDGPTFSGWQATYGTGGYYVDLPTSLAKAKTVVKDLRQRRWLDNSTTVLFVDFLLYNPQINVFISAKLVFEALSAGGMAYVRWLYPLNLYQYAGGNALMTYAVQAIWIVVMLSHVVKNLLQIKKQGRKYFKDGWNLFDLAQLFVSLGVAGLFAARIYVIIGTITKIQNDHTSFVSMDLLVNWEDLMLCMYGIAFFMVIMLFFRNLGVNQFWALFVGTLSHGKADILSFATCFMVVSVMFAGLGYATMGDMREEFWTFRASLVTLIQNIIGVVGPLMSLAKTSRFIMLYCFLYSSIVMFLSVQFFVAIISVVYSLVKTDIEGMTQWDGELAGYMTDELKKLFVGKRKAAGISGKESDEQDEEPLKPIGKGPCATLERAVARLSKDVDETIEIENKKERLVFAWTAEQELQQLRSATPRRDFAHSARRLGGLFDLPMERQWGQNYNLPSARNTGNPTMRQSYYATMNQYPPNAPEGLNPVTY